MRLLIRAGDCRRRADVNCRESLPVIITREDYLRLVTQVAIPAIYTIQYASRFSANALERALIELAIFSIVDADIPALCAHALALRA